MYMCHIHTQWDLVYHRRNYLLRKAVFTFKMTSAIFPLNCWWITDVGVHRATHWNRFGLFEDKWEHPQESFLQSWTWHSVPFRIPHHLGRQSSWPKALTHLMLLFRDIWQYHSKSYDNDTVYSSENGAAICTMIHHDSGRQSSLGG